MDFNNNRDFNYINALVFNRLNLIPEDIDLIVGIPRSGLIIFTMIAEFRSKPSTDLFSYLNDIPVQKIASGSLAPNYDVTKAKHILLVDDAVGFGISMTNAKNMILQKKNVKITTYTVFTEDYGKDKVDVYCEILKDQFLPWSTLKRSVPEACVDIDGVLTEDVPPAYDDDGEKYKTFLKNQRPLFIPDREIHTLVTSRLEKYRDITVDWLRRHNVMYKNLVMLNLPTMQDRWRGGLPVIAEYKANAYKESKLPLFIESNYNEAALIHKNTGKPVFCTSVCQFI